MNNHFTVSELCIDPNADIPREIADKILVHHIVPMNPVREELGEAITASQHSGWRPEAWEKARGRSGTGQHTFSGKGAIDWTASDLKRLFELIVEKTEYTRIAVYPDGEGWFIHCDYRYEDRVLFLSNSRSKWERAEYDDIIKELDNA